MEWVWILAVWVLVAVGFAVLVGRSIRLADSKTRADAVVEERPLHAVPPPTPTRPARPTAAGIDSPPEPSVAPPPSTPGGAGRDAPTVPGIPSARPDAGHPPNSRSRRPQPRRFGHG
jgi:hypothetical protein